MDGANSLKRRADAGGADKPQRRETQRKRKGKERGRPTGGSSGPAVQVLSKVRINDEAVSGGEGGVGVEREREDTLDDEGDRTGTEARCGSTWKVANRKDTDITGCEQTGLFGVLCRHGLIKWLVEMVRSGDLCVFFPRVFHLHI